MKKLKNKKTGEIGELQTTEKHYAVVVGNGTANCNVKLYCSLAKLNESWEDYEKPIQVYIEGIQNVFMSGGRVYIDYATAKEAELAVRKLKAWKRLKDKGFKFNRWTIPEEPKTPHIKLVIEAEMDVPDSPYDLDLLFSQEDD